MKKYILLVFICLIMAFDSYSNDSINSFKVRIYIKETPSKIKGNLFIRSFKDTANLDKMLNFELKQQGKNLMFGESTLCSDLKLSPELYSGGSGVIFNTERINNSNKKDLKITVNIISQNDINDNYKIKFVASLDSFYLINANVKNQEKQFIIVLSPAFFDVKSYLTRTVNLPAKKNITNKIIDIEWIKFIIDKHKGVIDTSRNRYWRSSKDSLIAFCDGNSVNNNETIIINADLFMKEGNNYLYIKAPKIIHNYNNGSDTLTIFNGTINKFKYSDKSLLPISTFSGEKLKIIKGAIPYTILKL